MVIVDVVFLSLSQLLSVTCLSLCYNYLLYFGRLVRTCLCSIHRSHYGLEVSRYWSEFDVFDHSSGHLHEFNIGIGVPSIPKIKIHLLSFQTVWCQQHQYIGLVVFHAFFSVCDTYSVDIFFNLTLLIHLTFGSIV